MHFVLQVSCVLGPVWRQVPRQTTLQHNCALFCNVGLIWDSQAKPRGDLTDLHHKAQTAHKLATLFYCSHQMICVSSFTCSNVSTHQITIHIHSCTKFFSRELFFQNPFSYGRPYLWKHPFVLGLDVRVPVQLVKIASKIWNNGWAYWWFSSNHPP